MRTLDRIPEGSKTWLIVAARCALLPRCGRSHEGDTCAISPAQVVLAPPCGGKHGYFPAPALPIPQCGPNVWYADKKDHPGTTADSRKLLLQLRRHPLAPGATCRFVNSHVDVLRVVARDLFRFQETSEQNSCRAPSQMKKAEFGGAPNARTHR